MVSPHLLKCLVKLPKAHIGDPRLRKVEVADVAIKLEGLAQRRKPWVKQGQAQRSKPWVKQGQAWHSQETFPMRYRATIQTYLGP